MAGAHGAIYRALHGPTVGDPPLKLIRHVFCNQPCIQVWLLNFGNIQLDAGSSQRLKFRASNLGFALVREQKGLRESAS